MLYNLIIRRVSFDLYHWQWVTVPYRYTIVSDAVLWIRITLMRIRMRMRIRIRLITLMTIRIWFLFDADADPNLDPTFHPDTDPEPEPSFQIKAQTLWKSAQIGSYSIYFGLLSANWCWFASGSSYITLMRTRMMIQIWIFIWCGCGSGCGCRLPKWCGSMRIRMRNPIHNTDLMGVIRLGTFQWVSHRV